MMTKHEYWQHSAQMLRWVGIAIALCIAAIEIVIAIADGPLPIPLDTQGHMASCTAVPQGPWCP